MDQTQTLYVQRFSVFQRLIHLLVILSFLTLAITGMALKFAMQPWAQWISDISGGFVVLGALHRFCALITFFYFFLTLILLRSKWQRSGKPLLRFLFDPEGLMPSLNDLKEIVKTIKWYFGGEHPNYGHWTYWEKFDFFAVFWGVAVIGLSGLALWFPEEATRIIPGYWLNIATIIHSDEALLASGFIFTIHFYNTHLRPEKWPLDPVIFTGLISVEELQHERPREYEQMKADGRLLDRRVITTKTPEPWFNKMVMIFGFFVVFTGVVLIIAIIVTMWQHMGAIPQ